MASSTEPEVKRKGRTVPFQVICVGMCRTGTQSLADALQILGIGPIYHMREVGRNGHRETWIKALEAKFEGKGKPFEKEDWDELLGGFAGTSDIPTAFFVPELRAAYPHAMFIHTTRSEDSWVASMNRTLWASQKARMAEPPGTPQRPMAALANTYWRVYWSNDFERTGRAKWQQREAEMRALAEEVRKEGGKWLEFPIGGGWEELCGFLGRDVPRGEDGEVLEWPNHDDARLSQKTAVEVEEKVAGTS